MKFLAFSDLHDDQQAFEKLKKLAPSFNNVFLCGDLTSRNQFAHEILASFPNGLIIPGNGEPKHVQEVFSGSRQWIHEKKADLGEINVVGFGLSPPTPFGTYGEIPDKEIYSRMSKLPISTNTILLLHAPPKGHFDEVKSQNVGSLSILRIIQEKKPMAAVFGHIHERQGTEMLGETLLVKLPAAMNMRACIISYQDKKLDAQFIVL
ncbi:metallophosphoesterase family protein [Candidatus Micrarchaeota archaeon]|nr:metallophosphoesterase family protein [Candidatus Micrarchaeota archaeon]